MSKLAKVNWVNVSNLDTFCDNKNLPGFQQFLSRFYDTSKDGWPEHTESQLRAAHKELTKIVYESDYDFEEVEQYNNDL